MDNNLSLVPYIKLFRPMPEFMHSVSEMIFRAPHENAGVLFQQLVAGYFRLFKIFSAYGSLVHYLYFRLINDHCISYPGPTFEATQKQKQ